MALTPQTKVSMGRDTIWGRAAATVPANSTATPTTKGRNRAKGMRSSRTLRAPSRQAPKRVMAASTTGSTSQGDTPYSNRRTPSCTTIWGAVIKTLPRFSSAMGIHTTNSSRSTKVPRVSVK